MVEGPVDSRNLQLLRIVLDNGVLEVLSLNKTIWDKIL